MYWITIIVLLKVAREEVRETEEVTNEEPHKPDKPVEQVGKRKNKNKNKYQEITVGPTTVGQAIAEVSEVEANGYSTFHGKTNITN